MFDVGENDEVWRYIERIDIERRTVLCRPGDLVNSVCIVQSGKVSAYELDDDDGTRTRVATMKRGAYVNEFSIFADMHSSHLVIADTDCTLLSISNESLRTMEEHNPEIAIEIMRTVMRHYWQNISKTKRQHIEVDRFKSMSDKVSRGTHFHPRKQTYALRRGSHAHNPESMFSFGSALTELAGKYADGTEITAIFEDSNIPSDDKVKKKISIARHHSFSGEEHKAKQDLEEKNALKSIVEDDAVDTHVLRMSLKMESECRECFEYHDEDRHGRLTVHAVADALQDMGHFLDQHEILLLIANGKHRFRAALGRASPHLDIEAGQDEKEENMDDDIDLKLLFVGQVGLFQEVVHHDPSTLGTLASLGKLVRYHKGDYVCVQGEIGHGIIIVFEGKVAIFQNDHEQNQKILTIKSKPIVMGEVALFTNDSKRTANVVCACQTLVSMLVSRKDLQNAFDEDHFFWKQLRRRSMEHHARDQKREKAKKLEKENARQLRFGEKFKSLTKIPFFKEITNGDHKVLTQLANTVQQRVYAEHDHIVNQGDKGQSLLVITYGNVSIHLDHIPNFKPIHLKSTKSEPIVLGEMALMSADSKRSATVIVESDLVRALELTRDDLCTIFPSSHFVWGKLRERYNATKKKDAERKSNEKGADKKEKDTMKKKKGVTFSENKITEKPNNSKDEKMTKKKKPKSMQQHNTINVFEFLDIVQHVRLYQLSHHEASGFTHLFEKYCDDEENLLSSHGLNAMLTDSHRQVDPLELEHVVSEWFVEQDESIDLGGFLSMAAYFLKLEQLDHEVRSCFQKLRWVLPSIPQSNLLRTKRVVNFENRQVYLTVDGVINKDSILKYYNVDLQKELTELQAEEMIFEADTQNKGYLNYRMWVDTLRTAHDSELELTQLEKKIRKRESNSSLEDRGNNNNVTTHKLSMKQGRLSKRFSGPTKTRNRKKKTIKMDSLNEDLVTKNSRVTRRSIVLDWIQESSGEKKQSVATRNLGSKSAKRNTKREDSLINAGKRKVSSFARRFTWHPSKDSSHGNVNGGGDYKLLDPSNED